MDLTVCETFTSLMGESTRAGLPAFFIRLTGCNLRCGYCDTLYAYDGGGTRSVASLVDEAHGSGRELVLVTGGEPLLQENTPALLAGLVEAGLEVLLETNGSLPIAGLDPRVRRIVDLKCPASGMSAYNLWDNLTVLTPRDEVKFVVMGEDDFTWALDVARAMALPARCRAYLTGVWGTSPAGGGRLDCEQRAAPAP